MAWRAGPCFKPAGSTQPKITSSISLACKPARRTTSLIATAPKSGAVHEDKTIERICILVEQGSL